MNGYGVERLDANTVADDGGAIRTQHIAACHRGVRVIDEAFSQCNATYAFVANGGCDFER